MNKRYHFAYTDVASDQDKQLWIDADGFASAYDKFWSILDGEDNIDKIEVEVHSLKCIEDTPEVYEWVPDGVI